MEQVLDTLIARWYTDDFIESQPEIVQRRLRQVVDTHTETFMNVFRIYAGTEMMPWLHEVRSPALVLTGECDGGCNPRLNRLIATALPDSELVILPRLKHAILLEAGETVADPAETVHRGFNDPLINFRPAVWAQARASPYRAVIAAMDTLRPPDHARTGRVSSCAPARRTWGLGDRDSPQECPPNGIGGQAP